VLKWLSKEIIHVVFCLYGDIFDGLAMSICQMPYALCSLYLPSVFKLFPNFFLFVTFIPVSRRVKGYT